MPTYAEELCKQWMSLGLSSDSLNPDPIKQFELWYAQAIDAGIPEPNALSLATVDADGQPWIRTVLMKIYDESGFVFFTNLESNKAAEIKQVQQIPIQTVANNTVTVSFRDAALTLSVTPQISNNGTVSLNVRPTISRIVGFAVDPAPRLAGADFDNLIPEIQVREIESLLQVLDGNTIDGDGCQSNCQLPTCGDNVTNGTETDEGGTPR